MREIQNKDDFYSIIIIKPETNSELQAEEYRNSVKPLEHDYKSLTLHSTETQTSRI